MRIHSPTGTWSDATTTARLEAARGALHAAGVRPGSHVGLIAATDPVSVAVTAAAHAAEAVLVPLAPRLAVDSLVAQARNADVDLLVARKENEDLAKRVADAIDVPCLVVAGEGAEWTPPARVIARPRAADQALALILHTSGTTRAPRAWALPRKAVDLHAERAAKNLGLDGRSVVLAVLPLFLVGGQALLARALRLGHDLVLAPRFDAAETNRLLHAHRVTHTSLVPVMLDRLLAIGATPPAELRVVLLGGDAAPRALLERAWEAGWPVLPTYGLTEAGSQVATAQPEEAKARPGTVGRPLRGIDVEVRDEEGRVLGAGRDGWIFVAGDTLGIPYPLPADSPRWIATGDVGHLDADGFLYVRGRDVERIVSGGRTLAARDVEAVLAQCPGVAGVCVVGLPDAEWGERVVAAVEPVRGACLRADEVSRFARERLAPHEVPRMIRIVPRLPRTAMGKLDRGAVVTKLRADHGATVPT